jgi:polyhydroxyalkanoate synthase
MDQRGTSRTAQTPLPPVAPPGFALGSPAVLGRSMADIAERSQRLVADWLHRQSREAPDLHPMHIAHAFMEMTAQLMRSPAEATRAQLGLWQDYMTLWQATSRRMWGMKTGPVIEEDPRDRRFEDSAWKEIEVFNFIKQSYLLTARYVQGVVARVDKLDPKTAQKVDFYSRQFMDAISPANFLMTNPEVLRKTVETGGENLLRGLSNLLSDLERGRGKLTMGTAGLEEFKVGKDVAASPGKVVFQNDLMQLIQYSPATGTVLRRPLLIAPPWNRKFYVLDLRPQNSFVRWSVEQGHTVFMISWVNPDERSAGKGFEHYLSEGTLAALDAIERATGEREVNAIGYCLGGTLLASALAWMAAVGDDRIKSATFLATMLDFKETGELSVFINEEQLRTLEDAEQRGIPDDDTQTAATLKMLRANDLIWSFVVNNYMLGHEPFPFDLLYWNGDGIRVPALMQRSYLRWIYQDNLLREPGGIEVIGQPINLGRVTAPSYFLTTCADHIAPWRSAYAGMRLLDGPSRFVLAAGGHVAGVVNSPQGGKYSYRTNAEHPADPATWLSGATEMAGSWWPDWQRWVMALDNAHVPARVPGDGALTTLEDAPGSYVRSWAR